MYTVPASIATGGARLACCQPVLFSPRNVTDASRVPVAVQSEPMCGPALPGPLKNRIAVMNPARSDWNRRPTSTLVLSANAGTDGTAAGGQIVHGHAPGWVVALTAWTSGSAAAAIQPAKTRTGDRGIGL